MYAALRAPDARTRQSTRKCFPTLLSCPTTTRCKISAHNVKTDTCDSRLNEAPTYGYSEHHLPTLKNCTAMQQTCGPASPSQSSNTYTTAHPPRRSSQARVHVGCLGQARGLAPRSRPWCTRRSLFLWWENTIT